VARPAFLLFRFGLSFDAPVPPSLPQPAAFSRNLPPSLRRGPCHLLLPQLSCSTLACCLSANLPFPRSPTPPDRRTLYSAFSARLLDVCQAPINASDMPEKRISLGKAGTVIVDPIGTSPPHLHGAGSLLFAPSSFPPLSTHGSGRRSAALRFLEISFSANADTLLTLTMFCLPSSADFPASRRPRPCSHSLPAVLPLFALAAVLGLYQPYCHHAATLRSCCCSGALPAYCHHAATLLSCCCF
jgi:hypothetical protein